MATVGLIAKYKQLFRKLFPQGFAWDSKAIDGTEFADFIAAMAVEPARIEQRGFDFLDEMDPNTTFEMLDNWERLLNIPDECTPDDYDPSLFERRVRVLQKLTTGGGQNEAFFKLIAQQLGYDVDIFDVEDYKDFRVGTARVGDALTNGTGTGLGWAYTFSVKAPAEFVRRFRTGQSTVGERLVLAENQTLECIVRKFAPAHVTVLFSIGG